MSHYQNLPNGWSECKIEDVAKTLTDFVASGSFASLRENVKYYDSPNYAILVRTKDLGNSFKRGLVYTDKHGYDFLSNSNLYGGELILPNIGASIGKVFLMPKIEAPTTLAPNSIMIRCWEEPTLKWLYLLFQSTLGQNILASISASTAQGKFNKTDLRDVIIPLPPLYEQERILTQADRLLEYVEKINTDKTDLTNILNSAKSKILELAMQGKLVPQDPADEPAADMLRRVNPKARIITDNPHYPKWLCSYMGDVCEFERGITFPSNTKRFDKVPGYIACLRTANVHDEVDLSSLWYISEEYLKGNDAKKLKVGDVLMSTANSKELVGRSVLIRDLSEHTTFGGFVTVLRTQILLPEFFTLFLKYKTLKGDFSKIATQTTNIANLNTRILSTVIIPVPPTEEQSRIIQRVNRLFSVLDEIEASLQS